MAGKGGVIRRESDVRAAIRAVYGPDAVWIEAARGGTQGAHDVICHNGPVAVSVELKAWERTPKGTVLAILRPAQVRLHAIAAQRGWASVIVFGVVGEAGLRVISSRDAPKEARAYLPEGFGVPLPDLRGKIVLDAPEKAFRNALQAVAGVGGHSTTPPPL